MNDNPVRPEYTITGVDLHLGTKPVPKALWAKLEAIGATVNRLSGQFSTGRSITIRSSRWTPDRVEVLNEAIRVLGRASQRNAVIFHNSVGYPWPQTHSKHEVFYVASSDPEPYTLAVTRYAQAIGEFLRENAAEFARVEAEQAKQAARVVGVVRVKNAIPEAVAVSSHVGVSTEQAPDGAAAVTLILTEAEARAVSAALGKLRTGSTPEPKPVPAEFPVFDSAALVEDCLGHPTGHRFLTAESGDEIKLCSTCGKRWRIESHYARIATTA